MEKNKLSVCWAVHNEEDKLKKSMQSAADIADEIVVVDGESTDQTVEKVEEFKHAHPEIDVKIIVTSNKKMFHINKQMAVDNCTGNWILQLDADEEVSVELSTEIVNRIKQENPKEGYYIPRKNYFLGRFLTKGGAYPDYVIRLFQKGKGMFPCETVHEQIEIKGEVGYLENDLLHWADPSFKRYWQRFNRYTEETADKLAEMGVSLNPFSVINYLLVKPIYNFTMIYFRHKGFLDGWQGFAWAFFSALHWADAYIKLIKKK